MKAELKARMREKLAQYNDGVDRRRVVTAQRAALAMEAEAMACFGGKREKSFPNKGFLRLKLKRDYAVGGCYSRVIVLGSRFQDAMNSPLHQRINYKDEARAANYIDEIHELYD